MKKELLQGKRSGKDNFPSKTTNKVKKVTKKEFKKRLEKNVEKLEIADTLDQLYDLDAQMQSKSIDFGCVKTSVIQHSSTRGETKFKGHNLTIPGQDVKTEVDQMFDDYVGQVPVPVMSYIEVPVIVSDKQPPVMMIQPAVPPLPLLRQSPPLVTAAMSQEGSSPGVIRARHPAKYNSAAQPVCQSQCVHEVEKLMETKTFDRMLLDSFSFTWMGHPQESF